MSASHPNVDMNMEENTKGIDHLAWRCGDSFNFPPMEKGSDGDAHWKTVSDHLTEQQRARCEDWRDEVQTLLVFSGLFSAVVTGLLVESYKSLSEDPIQVLLTKLVDQGASSGNQSIANAVPSEASSIFYPSGSSKRVNALWFLSLVLNIATALFGIVALQWLRELLRPSPQNAPIRQLTGLLYMQNDALDRFMVPEIFASLPLLLIFSLILFLVGMVDFLWNLNHQITIPVMLAVFLVFSFLLFTTIYPGLQSLPCHIPNKRKSATPRAPCPYRSPQSWAFLSLVISMKSWLRHTLVLLLPYLKIRPPFLERHFSQVYYKAGWIQHGLLWLRQRDLDVLAFHSDESLSDLSLWFTFPDKEDLPLGLYDTINAMLTTKKDFSRTHSDKLPDIFQCFHELTEDSKSQYSYYIVILYIHDYLLRLEYRPLSPRPGDWPFDDGAREGVNFSVDNARLWFLFDSSPTRIPIGATYHLELCVRLMRWAAEHIGTECKLLGHQEYPGSHLWQRAKVQPHVLEEIVPQIRHILSQFFDVASTYHPRESEIGRTLLTTPFLQFLLEGSIIVLGDREADFIDTVLAKVIKRLSQRSSEGLEYLLVAAAIFAGQMDTKLFGSNEEENLLQAIYVCNQRCNQDYVSKLFDSIGGSKASQKWPRYVRNLLPSSELVGRPQDPEDSKLSLESEDEEGTLNKALTMATLSDAGPSTNNSKPIPLRDAEHPTPLIHRGSNQHQSEGKSSSPISSSAAHDKHISIDIRTGT